MKQVSTGKFFPIIFHLVLWSIWIGLPIINAGENEKFRTFAIWIIPVTLMNIPLFLMNSEWLVPKVFRRKGITVYLLSLVLLILAFSVIEYFMKEWIIPPEKRFNRNSIFWVVVPVLFVTAISTGYGFIMYLTKQEKARQEEQEERLKSELSFLRSQISPHFIFNVLNSIVYLIRSQSELAEPVTIKLSELMRYILYTSEQDQVPLSEEVEYLENYFGLQKIRFEEDVDIRLDIQGQAGTHLIEPMILIPFVENAFKHGIGLIAEPVIDVRLLLENNEMQFTVRNKVAATDQTNSQDPDSGIGLRNVRRRLELLYPDTHQLDIQEVDGWFVVNLILKLSFSTPSNETPFTHIANEAPLHSR